MIFLSLSMQKLVSVVVIRALFGPMLTDSMTAPRFRLLVTSRMNVFLYFVRIRDELLAEELTRLIAGGSLGRTRGIGLGFVGEEALKKAASKRAVSISPKKVLKKVFWGTRHFGLSMADYDIEMMAEHNRKVRDKHAHEALNEETGVAALSISPELAGAISKDVKTCLSRGLCEGKTKGEFIYERKIGRRTQTVVVKGFSTYQPNHGTQDEQNGERQMKHTTTFDSAQLKTLKATFSSFRDAFNIVTEYSGMEIGKIDILRQSSTGIGGGKEALFKWHRDNDGDRTDIRMTVIFSLNETKSSMEVLGFKEFHYDKPGSGIAFPSNYWHRSVQAEAGTIKLALFLTGKSKRCETQAWKQCICKKLDPPTKKRGWLVEDWFQCNACDRWCHGVCAKKHGKFVGDEFFCCR